MRATFIAVLIGAFAAIPAAAAPKALTKSFADPERGVSFTYPARFEIGKYRGKNEMPKDWADVAVLVETRQLAGSPASAVPRGDIPDIEIVETTGLSARMQVGSAATQGKEYKKTFGRTAAYKFPGAFGPFGGQAHFYLVPIAPDRALMIIAHKYYFRDPAHSQKTPVSSGYDEVVDALLSTLEVKAK